MKNVKTPRQFFLCSLLVIFVMPLSIKNEIFTLLQQPVKSANPIKNEQSNAVEWLPGFTERDVLIIAIAGDLNQGAFSVLSYGSCKTFSDCQHSWNSITSKANKPPEGSIYGDYQKIHVNPTSDDNMIKKPFFIKKLDKALARMLHHPRDFNSFYNLKKIFELKSKLLKMLSFLLMKESPALAGWFNVLTKLGHNIINYENTLLEFDMINDSLTWEERKARATNALYPLTKSTELLSKMHAALSPFDAKDEVILSQVFLDHLEQRYNKLAQKLDNAARSLRRNKQPVDWVETTTFDPEIFAKSDGSLIALWPPAPTKQKLTGSFLHPFGNIPSAPSPIPGLSWRRLAELCSSAAQTFHSQDFSSVIDWLSFFNFMMRDNAAATNPESLFANFLRIYAPETFFNTFKTHSDPDMLSRESMEKIHYDLIANIITLLKTPHKAHLKYTVRKRIAQQEGQLLEKLLHLYHVKQKDTLPTFPRIIFVLKDPTRPQNIKYTPDNVAFRFNTSNPELYKAVVNLYKLNYLETASDAVNTHAGWSAASTAAKAPLFAATAPITVIPRVIESHTPTEQRRTIKTAKGTRQKRENLTKKIHTAVSRITKTPVVKAFKKYASLQKVRYAKSDEYDDSEAFTAAPPLKQKQRSSTARATKKAMPEQAKELIDPTTPVEDVVVVALHEQPAPSLRAARTVGLFDF